MALMDVLDNENALNIFSALQRTEHPIGATRIAKISGVPRSTVYHQLKKLIESGLVHPVQVSAKSNRKKYEITDRGRRTDAGQSGQTLKEMIAYFHYLQVPENIIWQLVTLLKPRLDQFMMLPQNPELYMALFYVYYNLTTTDLRLNRKEFCKIFHVKQIALNYYLDKVLSGNLGFYHFEHMGDDHFFHDADELGVVLRQRLDTFFEQQDLRRQLGGETDPLPLQEFIDQTAEDLAKRGYIRPELQRTVALFLWDFVGKYCIEQGIAGDLLPEIPDASASRAPSVVEDIRGYCSRCGNWIFQGTARCERCFTRVADMELLSDCVRAVGLAQEYEYILRDNSITCAHCGQRFPITWDLSTCPRCGEAFPGDNTLMASESVE